MTQKELERMIDNWQGQSREYIETEVQMLDEATQNELIRYYAAEDIEEVIDRIYLGFE